MSCLAANPYDVHVNQDERIEIIVTLAVVRQYPVFIILLSIKYRVALEGSVEEENQSKRNRQIYQRA